MRFEPIDTFAERHIGPDAAEQAEMLRVLDCRSLDALIDEVVPAPIRLTRDPRIETPGARGTRRGEYELLATLRGIAEQNQVFRSLLGYGYADTIVPPVIQRNVLENPGWYTQYTPYQAEISQGRLEALLNFQTMVADLTGLPLANASLLDEATAAAEAMAMCHRIARGRKHDFFVADDCHPQTIALLQTRAEPLGIRLHFGSLEQADFSDMDLAGALVQNPATDGRLHDVATIAERVHAAGGLLVCATDLLALLLIRPPGACGADIAIGSAQRFGVPLGYGGPHAAFLATHEKHARQVPGRVIGVSHDSQGKTAYRMSVQTREQHIRRDKATSNICTAQALLAIMAAMFAVYHGPDGLRRIARRVHRLTAILADRLEQAGHRLRHAHCFDTIRVEPDGATVAAIRAAAERKRINLRYYDDGSIGISLDQKSTLDEVNLLLDLFGVEPVTTPAEAGRVPAEQRRDDQILTHPVFHRYHTEHEMLRYLHRLQGRDLSLTTSMIPLGSCTMKLNATSQMLPVTWPEFAALHPFAPPEQAAGYRILFQQLETWLAELTGLPAVSLQPNAGAQGEYAGLLVIRAYHKARGDSSRDVCLIPVSAHGTNPASAIMAGLRVVPVQCDARGNIDLPDLNARIEQHKNELAALMITYPSTHGVFEEQVQEICAAVHAAGGQVYMDGANMNAQLGLCSPGSIGADVCHLNLHKTFCIPHGGGGPGMGPIAVAEHLAAYLPGHPVIANREDAEHAIGPVSAAPWGSPSILPISWVYIALMGTSGLTRATQVAILNANYMAARIGAHFPILFTGKTGRVAHEFIVDLRPFKESACIETDDVAKRLMDYGFHAPTMSWPVPGTLMIEPTESESKAELDRLCDAMIAIRAEIAQIEDGTLPRDDNPLKNAPHTAAMVTASEWTHPYPREQAAFPAAWLRDGKFWPSVARIDNVYGDRHLFCTCPPVEEVAAQQP